MKIIKKSEIIGIILILFSVVLLSYLNIQISYQKARDLQRRDDLTALSNGLEKFKNDFKNYPLSSSDGKIKACLLEGKTTEDMKKFIGNLPELNRPKLLNILGVCSWGNSELRDVSDYSITPYLTNIPKDSLQDKGYSYLYYSDGKSFTLYGSFERKDLPEYSKDIAKLKLRCGTAICNFSKINK